MTTQTHPTFTVDLRDGYLVAQVWKYVAPVLTLGPMWSNRTRAEQEVDS